MEDIGQNSKKQIKMKWIAVVILISYLGMWLLYRKAEYSFLQKQSLQWFEMVYSGLLCLAVGILLYAIPYEMIRGKVRCATTSFSKDWELEDRTGMLFSALIMAFFYIGTGIVFCICAEVLPLGTGVTDVCAMLLTFLSLVVLMDGIYLIRNKWILAIYAVIMIFGHAFMIVQITEKFTFAAVILMAELAVWVITALFVKKMNIIVLLVSVVCLCGMFYPFIYITDHGNKLWMFQEGFTTISGEMLIASYEQTGRIPSGLVHSNYMFTVIKGDMGVPGLVVFALLFVIMSVATGMAIYRLKEESVQRAGVVLGIYLIFVMSAIYGILSEAGILPISNVWLFNGRINVPLIFVAFRMFDVRRAPIKEVPQ